MGPLCLATPSPPEVASTDPRRVVLASFLLHVSP
jgi:hypothetical protein